MLLGFSTNDKFFFSVVSNIMPLILFTDLKSLTASCNMIPKHAADNTKNMMGQYRNINNTFLF